MSESDGGRRGGEREMNKECVRVIKNEERLSVCVCKRERERERERERLTYL